MTKPMKTSSIQAKTKREALAMARALIHVLKPGPRGADGKRERLEAEKLWDNLCAAQSLDKVNAALAEIMTACSVAEEV